MRESAAKPAYRNAASVHTHLRMFPADSVFIAARPGQYEHVCAGCPHALTQMFYPCLPATRRCEMRYRVALQEKR
jgi:hypothetical protein